MGPSGFEPLTPVLSGLCSNQLSYGPEFKCNGLPIYPCNALIHYTYTINRKPYAAQFRLERKAPALKFKLESQALDRLAQGSSNFNREKKIRKEVIQPHLPVRLPCYDLAPVTGFTLDLN